MLRFDVLAQKQILRVERELREMLRFAFLLGCGVARGERDRAAVGAPRVVLDTRLVRRQPARLAASHRHEIDLRPPGRVGRDECERLAVGRKVRGADGTAVVRELTHRARRDVDSVKLRIVSVRFVLASRDGDDRELAVGTQLDAANADEARKKVE